MTTILLQAQGLSGSPPPLQENTVSSFAHTHSFCLSAMMEMILEQWRILGS